MVSLVEVEVEINGFINFELLMRYPLGTFQVGSFMIVWNSEKAVWNECRTWSPSWSLKSILNSRNVYNFIIWLQTEEYGMEPCEIRHWEVWWREVPGNTCEDRVISRVRRVRPTRRQTHASKKDCFLRLGYRVEWQLVALTTYPYETIKSRYVGMGLAMKI